jgi:hypothetical protein
MRDRGEENALDSEDQAERRDEIKHPRRSP